MISMTKKCRRLAKSHLIGRLEDDKASNLKSAINNSVACLDFLTEVLENRMSELDKLIMSDSVYELPAYSEALAGLIASKKEVRNLITLISETEE